MLYPCRLLSAPPTGSPTETAGMIISGARKARIHLYFIPSLFLSISQFGRKTSNIIFLFDNIDHGRYNEQKALIKEGNAP